MDDGEMAAKAFDNFEDMRGEKNRGAARDHALEHRFESAGSDRVHAFEGLIEKKNFRTVDDGGGKGQFFLHAMRVIGNELLGLVGELHEIEEFGGALGGGLAIEAVHAADKIQILRAGQPSEEGHAFGDDADLALHFDGVGGEIEAEDFDASRGRGEQASEHLDSGGFAGAVRSEEAEELPRGDAQAYILYGGEGAEAARQTLGGDGGRIHVVFDSNIEAEKAGRGSRSEAWLVATRARRVDREGMNRLQKVPDLSRLEIGINFIFLRLSGFLIAGSRLGVSLVPMVTGLNEV